MTAGGAACRSAKTKTSAYTSPFTIGALASASRKCGWIRLEPSEFPGDASAEAEGGRLAEHVAEMAVPRRVRGAHPVVEARSQA
jgi:hypothetical protein